MKGIAGGGLKRDGYMGSCISMYRGQDNKFKVSYRVLFKDDEDGRNAQKELDLMVATIRLLLRAGVERYIP